jgi:hypothetical protein
MIDLDTLPPVYREGFRSCMRTMALAAQGKQDIVYDQQCATIYGWAALPKSDRADLCQELAKSISLDPDCIQEIQALAAQRAERANGINWDKYDEEARANGSARTDRSVPWPIMGPSAYHGLAGEIVDMILPHSEADPAALLLQTLTIAGNLIGHGPYYQVESDRHHTSLNVVLVGDSAKGRKGTSLGRVRAVAKVADQIWSDDRLKGGLSSGEGFISEVRDPVRKWNIQVQDYEISDPGVTDKRLMVIEPEFAGVLAVVERHGNTLSPLIRRAWDGDKLTTITKSSPLCATGAHISIIGHVTVDELRARLTKTELANGFANRFLFVLVRRSKTLPFGGSITDSEILMLGERLKEVREQVGSFLRISLTEAASKIWAEVYPSLSEGKPGLAGAVIARAEAQTARLALIYALLDGCSEIDVQHLRAGLAVWKYCEASAAYIFGNALGDPTADDILRALRHAGAVGMTRTEISALFSRNKTADQIGTALAMLVTGGHARVEHTAGITGRPAERWFAVIGAQH